jgi:hypothetical protein
VLVVALTDAHGNEQAAAFLLSLVRDPRFAATVNDVVMECGNARYQDVIDRFVNGEDVPDESLRRVWQDTTQPSAACDVPIYEAFYRAVRALNASLPRERRLRVLLGDPPVDWDAVRTRDDHFKWIEMREWHPAALIQLRRPSLCRDQAYMNMRLARIARSGIPPAEAERLKKYCAEVAPK